MIEFHELLESCGYTLITPYIKDGEKVSTICPEEHPWDIRPSILKRD